ncbi:MAG TPA: DUF1254 domain-containing protein [Anaerolineaceae bacterium]
MSKKKSKDSVGAPVAAGGEEDRIVPNGAVKAVQARNRRKAHLLTFALAAIMVWVPGTYAYIYFMPRMYYNALERAMTQHGIGATTNGNRSSGIPVNTLFAMSALASPTTLGSNFLEGTNHDTLYTTGWLDLSKGPDVLHVPDMADRYYSIEFVDPWGNVFAYVGRRTTGTQAGDYLIGGPNWQGAVPVGVTQIASPNNTVLLIGRVLVESNSDLATAYGLEKQIRLTPLSQWQPGQ